MTELEAEAMLIRHQKAMCEVGYCSSEGRWALLAAVVQPSEELLNVSLKAAERKGPTSLARWLANRVSMKREWVATPLFEDCDRPSKQTGNLDDRSRSTYSGKLPSGVGSSLGPRVFWREFG